MPDYLARFPQPLLDDLLAGRWLPVVGAGLSRNADVPQGEVMPLWDDLGRALAKDLRDYPYSGPLDAISAHAHEFGRPRMIERVSEALLVDRARPGGAHRAFCSIPFDVVCTTNIEFLLEQQYRELRRNCRPIIDEDHLTLNDRDPSTSLLKLHGDIHHPSRLVLTEEDYDSFLDRYPLIATYLSNLLITRTAVLVGYSLEDPDFRKLWQVIGDRLGQHRRMAYAVLVDAKPTDIDRFGRRGIKVINLPGSKARYGHILAEAFSQVGAYFQEHFIDASHVTDEDSLTELQLPPSSATRLCLFAVPLSMEAQYRDQVFPMIEEAGLVPTTAAEVIAPGDSYPAKIDVLMRRAALAVVDASSPNTFTELSMLRGLPRGIPTLVVVEGNDRPDPVSGLVMPNDLSTSVVLSRSADPLANQPEFLTGVANWIDQASEIVRPRISDEPTRLLGLKEYRAAVIAAMTALESSLRVALGKYDPRSYPRRILPLTRIADLAFAEELLTPTERHELREWSEIRNRAVHSAAPITRRQAEQVVNGAVRLARRLGG